MPLGKKMNGHPHFKHIALKQTNKNIIYAYLLKGSWKQSYSFNKVSKIIDTFKCTLEIYMIKYLSFRYEIAPDIKEKKKKKKLSRLL